MSAELGEIADQIRREYGAEFPPAPVRESHPDRQRRQEVTKYLLESRILPQVNETRVAGRDLPLTEDDEDRVVELILSSMFLLPRLLGILEQEPLAEDLLALGSSAVRVDRADGTMGIYPPLVREDRDLEQVIADVANAHHRPFSFESPYVDVQLSPRLRFHGQGFDVVSRPAIMIRVHRAFGATINDLFDGGTISAGMRYLLADVVPQARLSSATSGVQGSGKTTLLRAQILAYPVDTRILTIETDFELGINSLGRPWTQEMQARLPITSASRGITCGDQMPPALRSRADLLVMGEVRGDEGAAAVRAANVGQGTMCTVHGDSAEAGLEQLVDRVTEGGTPRDLARRMVYKSFDLVVQCSMARDRTRWVSEIVAPSMEGDRFVIHTLYSAQSGSGDLRGRAARTAWPDQLIAKIHANFPEFDINAALEDEYRPLARPAAAAPNEGQLEAVR
jgi:pilus assembly protein CpaF